MRGVCSPTARPCRAPGASVSCQYTVTRTDAGEYDNTARVDVSDDEGNEDSDSDDATFEVTDVAPTIKVDKSASPDSRPEPGGSFTYTVKVTNTSDEAVTVTSLSDDKFGDLDGEGTCAIGAELDPDESYTCTFSGSVTGNAGLTLEMKVQYMRPARLGPVRCTGRFLRRGRTLSAMESRMSDAEGQLLAMATATWKMP